MNVIGTVLERSESNKFYVKFKNEVGVVDDELYAWKVWILKKYFHDNVVINLVKMLIGVICFGLAASNMVIKVLGKSGFSTLILIVLFALGFILIATGLLFSILNFRFGKRYEDFLWDEDGEIVNKIIKFYGKA